MNMWTIGRKTYCVQFKSCLHMTQYYACIGFVKQFVPDTRKSTRRQITIFRKCVPISTALQNHAMFCLKRFIAPNAESFDYAKGTMFHTQTKTDLSMLLYKLFCQIDKSVLKLHSL